MKIYESTVRNSESLIMCYVSYIKDKEYNEYMLFCKSIQDITSITVYYEIFEFFKKNNILLSNLIALATDGAPAMIGRINGVGTLLKKELPTLFTTHGVIHKEHLIATNLDSICVDSLDIIIQCTNKIKRNSLHERCSYIRRAYIQVLM